MPTLYLHIGRGKTGTSLIQQYLAERRDDLLRQGVHFVAESDGERGRGHQQFAKSFVSSAPEFFVPATNPELTRRKVADELCGATSDTLIMSSENFAIADIEPLVKFFQALPIQLVIKIIFFARSQDELAESEYNQVVKLAGINVSLDTYADTMIEGCDFFEVAEEWSAHFGYENMICRVYDGRNRNVINQFLACIPEIDVAGLTSFEVEASQSRANAAIGIRALWVARILNSVAIDARFKSYQPVFSLLADKDLPALHWNSQEARSYRERFAASNLAFSERFLGVSNDDLGGRRYSVSERDRVIAEIAALKEQLGLSRPN
jgi:hypothetical protein